MDTPDANPQPPHNIAPSPLPLTAAQRAARLQSEINKYLGQGYRVISQTETTAQLVKPRGGPSCLLLILFGLTVIGLIIYLIVYMRSRDRLVYLEVDEYGRVSIMQDGRRLAPQLASAPSAAQGIAWNARDSTLIALTVSMLLGGCCLVFVAFSAARPRAPATQIRATRIVTPTSLPTYTMDAPTQSLTSSAILPGLQTTDITASLIEKGFTCSDPRKGELYYYRSCKETETGIYEMVAEIYGRDRFTVDYVNAQVLQFTAVPSDGISTPFLGYIATLPYDGAVPSSARSWIERTLPTILANGDVHTETFGGVPYRLFGGPSSRILQIGMLEP